MELSAAMLPGKRDPAPLESSSERRQPFEDQARHLRRFLAMEEMAGFNEEIEVSYRDPDGRARLPYLDRNYNDTLGLLHQDAHKDAQAVAFPGIDKKLIEASVQSPIDLAVSKLGGENDYRYDRYPTSLTK